MSVNDLAAARVAELYERHAHHYDADRNRDLNTELVWLECFVSLLPYGADVLDRGCGHGEPIARFLIQNGCAVQGIDTSHTLISLCRKRFPQHEWRVADMRTLALGGEVLGLIAWYSFFHLPHADQRCMFPIFKLHAASNAVLLFTSGPSYGERIGSYRGESLYHASLSASEYSSLLVANGFRVKAQVTEDPDSGFHKVWLAQLEG